MSSQVRSRASKGGEKGVSDSSKVDEFHHVGGHGYEFGGPYVVTVLMALLPLTCYTLYFTCNADGCMSINPLSPNFLKFVNPFSHGLSGFLNAIFSLQALLVVLGWFFFQVVLHLVLPGQVVEGVPLDSKGTRLKYVMNGLLAMGVGMATVIALAYLHIFITPTYAYDHFVELLTGSFVFVIFLSLYLYITSLLTPLPYNAYTQLSITVAHNHIYDFWMGRSLNPRLAHFDFKFFCELRPGLIGWCLIDLSLCAAQYGKHGYITNSMVLVCAFQFYYVLDALMSESAILTTMDITTDGFGYMLCFGDLTWVPFVYSLQARYLVDHPVDLSYAFLAIILGVKLLGMYIFRGSNGQKNDFRTNPNAENVRHLKYIETKAGSKLLISGWWGIARHINYLGDLLMGLSWCLPCGFDHAIPYFYSVYFIVLLVHRELRDEEKCARKYGQDWAKYCSIVKYRILPYVY